MKKQDGIRYTLNAKRQIWKSDGWELDCKGSGGLDSRGRTQPLATPCVCSCSRESTCTLHLLKPSLLKSQLPLKQESKHGLPGSRKCIYMCLCMCICLCLCVCVCVSENYLNTMHLKTVCTCTVGRHLCK